MHYFQNIMAQSKLTRKVLNCVVFGSPSQLRFNMLPTYEDVMRYYICIKNGLKLNAGGREPKVADICETVTRQVERIWIKASIPAVSHTRVLKLLRSYHDRYMKLLKPYKARRKQETYQKQLTDFQTKAKATLFDIAACKCDDIDNCKCDKSRKVPLNERSFLTDQRTVRIMFISTFDHTTSRNLSRRQRRRQMQAQREQMATTSMKDATGVACGRKCRADLSDSTSAPNIESDDDIPLADLQQQMRCQRTRRNTRKIPTLARACDRHGVSDRAAAAIASAVLQDFGIISNEDPSAVIDRNKVRRSCRIKRTAAPEADTWTAGKCIA